MLAKRITFQHISSTLHRCSALTLIHVRSAKGAVHKGAAGLALTTLLVSGSVFADGPPEFFQNSLPEHAIGKMLESYGAFQGEGAELDARTRELIALGVAAQIPCTYCVYAHRNNALKAGASEAEVREAVAAGAYVRFWSAMFQGAEIDLEAFKTEHDMIREGR